MFRNCLLMDQRIKIKFKERLFLNHEYCLYTLKNLVIFFQYHSWNFLSKKFYKVFIFLRHQITLLLNQNFFSVSLCNASLWKLEKEMATHSSVLAWRIPGTEEPGGLPSMGSNRVGHDWSDLAAAAACENAICFWK